MSYLGIVEKRLEAIANQLPANFYGSRLPPPRYGHSERSEEPLSHLLS
jgi:hypothetical protein